ncbi:hypothetical protein [Dapis sp. BLCC M229]|uniref:hypothetical protein n=1 Tax=Dapis sp. BLCC M229 TaxID=3400188 RepID=UPI003CFACD6C
MINGISYYPEGRKYTYFLKSEEYKQILDRLEINYENIRLYFSHSISFESKNILEIYLRKCVLDDTLDLFNFFEPILQECFEPETNQYKFEQIVDLVIIEKASNI